MPTLHGEKVVLRLLEKEAVMQHLGFEPEQLEVFMRAIQRPWGMVLLTGPTGSGKSTTLNTGIKAIKSPRKNIVTVEDPVEIRKHATESGMVSLREAGLWRVIRGDTTLEEVMSVVADAD